MKSVRLLFISRPSLSISRDIHIGSVPPSRSHLPCTYTSGNSIAVHRPMNYSGKIFALCSCNERTALFPRSFLIALFVVFLNDASLLPPSFTKHFADSRILTCYPRSFRQEIAERFPTIYRCFSLSSVH